MSKVNVKEEFILPPKDKCKGSYTVQCKHCKPGDNDVAVCEGSTSNFWGHLRRNHLSLHDSLKKKSAPV